MMKHQVNSSDSRKVLVTIVLNGMDKQIMADVFPFDLAVLC